MTVAQNKYLPMASRDITLPCLINGSLAYYFLEIILPPEPY